MKKYFVILVLISIALAETSNVDVDLTQGIAFFDTDMEVNVDMDITPPGGQMCTGTYNVDPDIDITWATTGNPDIRSIYPGCAGGYCPSPSTRNTFSRDLAIGWLTPTRYDEIIDEAAYDSWSTDPSITNTFSVLWNQRVTYVIPRAGDDDILNNKLGKANIYCKGQVRVKLDGVTQSTMDSGSFSSVNIDIDTPGSYRITTELRNTDCLGVLLKDPEDRDRPAFFRLYYFTDNRPQNFVVTEEQTINVEAGNPSMTITAPPANTRFVLDEDRTQSVEIDVQNTGDAGIQVTGVSIVPPASDQFEVDSAGDRGCRVCIPGLGCYDPPGCRTSEDGFDVEIAPGNAQTLDIDIADIGAEACQGNSNAAVFVLTYEPVGEVCGGSEPQTVSRRYLIDCTNVPTGCTVHTDCEDNEICEGEGEDAICQEFTIDVLPNTATARSEGESVDFTATCRVDGAVKACNSIGTLEWTQAGTPVTLTPGTNMVTATTGSTAGAASITGRIQGKTPSDTSTLTIQYNGPGVVITPNTATVEETRSQEFEVTCYSRILDLTEVPCENVRWSSTGVPVTIAGRNDGATVTAGGVRGDATINAVATISGRDFSDDATLTVRAPIISCEIGPVPTENLEGNSPYEFEVECQRLGATIPCNPPLNWAVIGNADKIGEVGSSVVILTGNEDSGDSTITADPANTDAQCELILTVGTGGGDRNDTNGTDDDPPDDDDPPPRDEGCTITGSKTLTKGETNVFRITCEARPSGDCEGVQWSVQNQDYFEPFSSRDYDDHQLVLKVRDDVDISSQGIETHVSARNRGSVPAGDEFSCTIKSLLMSYLCEEIT